jgi:hypothetical protein
MAQFLNQNGIRFRNLKSFLTDNAAEIKAHARQMAAEAGRPFEYLNSEIKMERQARELATKNAIEQGLVCVFSILEPCRSYSFRFEKGRPFVEGARRKCLSIYYHFMDRVFGLDSRQDSYLVSTSHVDIHQRTGVAGSKAFGKRHRLHQAGQRFH